MSVVPFKPQHMRIGVLTAALQELTPRKVRDADPDKAIEDWLQFGRELGADDIQLSAALHPSESDVPPEAMLDPVANTLDLRRPFDKARASRVEQAVASTGVKISDVAYFDNLLHHDAATREKKHDFLLRVFDALGMCFGSFASFQHRLLLGGFLQGAKARDRMRVAGVLAVIHGLAPR